MKSSQVMLQIVEFHCQEGEKSLKRRKKNTFYQNKFDFMLSHRDRGFPLSSSKYKRNLDGIISKIFTRTYD
jgi:hypothetical protein